MDELHVLGLVVRQLERNFLQDRARDGFFRIDIFVKRVSVSNSEELVEALFVNVFEQHFVRHVPKARRLKTACGRSPGIDEHFVNNCIIVVV